MMEEDLGHAREDSKQEDCHEGAQLIPPERTQCIFMLCPVLSYAMSCVSHVTMSCHGI
jgi:hypothetical protein